MQTSSCRGCLHKTLVIDHPAMCVVGRCELFEKDLDVSDVTDEGDAVYEPLYPDCYEE